MSHCSQLRMRKLIHRVEWAVQKWEFLCDLDASHSYVSTLDHVLSLLKIFSPSSCQSPQCFIWDTTSSRPSLPVCPPVLSKAQSGDPPLGNSVRGLITLHHTLLVYLLTSLPVRTTNLSRPGILSSQDVTLGTKVGANHHAWYIAAAQKYSSIPNTTLNLVTFQYSQWLLKISLRNFCYKEKKSMLKQKQTRF